jgi:hypothetical protein
MPGRPLLSSGLPHLPPPIPTFPHTGGKGARAGSSPQTGKRSSGHFLMSDFQGTSEIFLDIDKHTSI